jgi:hypothetical protein
MSGCLTVSCLLMLILLAIGLTFDILFCFLMLDQNNEILKKLDTLIKNIIENDK